MKPRVALDADVVKQLLDALNWREGPAPDAQGLAALRIYFYVTNPLITPTVAAEIEQATEATWRNHVFEEIARQDDFYRGCVKGMAERYIDYHPDPRDCRVVAEAECAKADTLLTLNGGLVRGLGGRSEALNVRRPSEYWKRAHVPRGSTPRTTPAEASPLLRADWWRW